MLQFLFYIAFYTSSSYTGLTAMARPDCPDTVPQATALLHL